MNYRIWGFLAASGMMFAQPAFGQAAAQSPSAEPSPPAASARDVESIDAIIGALYDVISGGAGVKRDWDRFNSLYYPGARMIPTGMNPQTKKITAQMGTPADYRERSGPRLEGSGFHEKEIARRVDRFGNIAHVFSTYEARVKPDDPKPLLRGINSIQLFNDGSRWWVLSATWSPETPEHPIPPEYLRTP